MVDNPDWPYKSSHYKFIIFFKDCHNVIYIRMYIKKKKEGNKRRTRTTFFPKRQNRTCYIITCMVQSAVSKAKVIHDNQEVTYLDLDSILYIKKWEKKGKK